MTELYDMFFKRKSVRRFDGSLTLTEAELADIPRYLAQAKPLYPEIKTSYKLMKRAETNCKWGEYCLLAYSEEKEGSLINIGYLLEQLDLYLASRDIGVCWYGWGRTRERWIGDQRFVIMLALGKCRAEDFRKDYTQAARKELAELWQGELAMDAAQAARYAPSACNSQPWRVVCEGDNRLMVYRTTDVHGIAAKNLIACYNKIDMGIYLCFLETALAHFGYTFERQLFCEDASQSLIPTAAYILSRS